MADAGKLSTYEHDLRKWAVNAAGGNVRQARAILAFIIGEDDQSPKERILAALVEAGLT